MWSRCKIFKNNDVQTKLDRPNNNFINLFKSLNKTALQNYLNCLEEEKFIKVEDKYYFDSSLKVIGKVSKYQNYF